MEAIWCERGVPDAVKDLAKLRDDYPASSFTLFDPTMDEEHASMLEAVDTLYALAETHWKTEEDYYERGRRKMPVAHTNMQKEWESHREQHVAMLASIQRMKREMITHINDKDGRHFHWVIEKPKDYRPLASYVIFCCVLYFAECALLFS